MCPSKFGPQVSISRINVNRVAKSFFKSRFQKWYSDEITKQMNEGKGIYAVDLNTCLSRMKAIHAC